jgi:hypothetical protein
MDEQRDSGLGAASEAPAGDGPTTTLIEGGHEPWDGLIATLIEGGDEARGALLEDLAEGRVTASSAQRDRLIELMEGRYAPSSRKAADDGAPIRAWLISALLWIDGEHPGVRGLVLRHVQKRSEPDQTVRLRTLHGVWARGASYRADAAKLAARDPDRDVAFIAKAMASSPSELTAMLERSLNSGTFFQTQRVLAIMLIVAQPDLLAQVADLLDTRVEGRRLDGLALRVLAHPATAAAAAAILLERDGAVGLVRRLAVRTRDRPVDGSWCARLLAPVPTAEMRKALRSIAADEPALADTARALDRAAMMLRPEGARGGHYVAGFRSEELDVANDLLGVGEDVETLTAVMLSRHVDPPLAIGLFGDWGSGKSFFMKSMRRATERLMAEGSPEYCTDVVSIEFNAWHYVDGSLMASLVSHLLGALSSYLSPEDTAGKREADLMSGLAGAREVVAGITTAKADAEAELERRRKALEAAQKKRTEGEIRLRDLRLSDLQAVLNESPEARKALEGALNDLGAPAAIGAFTDLRDAVARAHTLEGRVLALARGLVKGPDRRVLIPLMIVLIGAPLSLLSLRELIPPTSRAWANLAAWLAEAGALAAAGAHVLKTAGQWVSGRLGDLEAARAKVQKVMDARRGEVAAGEAALAGEVAALKAEEDLMAERLRAATAKVADFEQQVADLRDGRSLTRFLSDRSGSQDYRRHEGVIAVVRRDFEALTQRLADPGAMKDGRRVDRIILYIDDLDRCPEEKVVEVLEAVHLLLAFRLFVVVVAVDSRWLEHALAKAYGAFDARARKPEWRTTPQDYLEKDLPDPDLSAADEPGRLPPAGRGSAGSPGGRGGRAAPAALGGGGRQGR